MKRILIAALFAVVLVGSSRPAADLPVGDFTFVDAEGRATDMARHLVVTNDHEEKLGDVVVTDLVTAKLYNQKLHRAITTNRITIFQFKQCLDAVVADIGTKIADGFATREGDEEEIRAEMLNAVKQAMVLDIREVMMELPDGKVQRSGVIRDCLDAVVEKVRPSLHIRRLKDPMTGRSVVDERVFCGEATGAYGVESPERDPLASALGNVSPSKQKEMAKRLAERFG